MGGYLILDKGWVAQRASNVNVAGEKLTESTVVDSKEWLPAVVPGTVLTTLVRNGVYPEPLYGLNNLEIPDIYHAGRDFYTYWFRMTFRWPQSPLLSKAETRYWIHFRGINYSSEIFLNGSEVHLKQPSGMFLRRALDVTSLAKKHKENKLAVLVHPPDHPGCVDTPGQGADHQIARDVSAQYVEGWDWICPIRDRNTGIWDQVSVEVTGPVAIRNPHVTTRFPGSNFDQAVLHVTAELVNNTDKDWTGRVHIEVSQSEDGFCSVEHVHTVPVKVAAHSANEHPLAQLEFKHPKLWWPNGLGKQELYDLSLELAIDVYGCLDTCNVRFGFRHVTSYIDKELKGRRFEVNGRPVFIRGGNWIVSDAMLRLSRERYQTEMRFHAEMGLNMIRVWGGALAERPEFYEACDEQGLLVWQEFWITGDCNGRGVPPSERSWPDDHALFLDCARDTVKLLRNHASLAIWVGGNEQIPSPDINEALEKELRLDDGSGPRGLLDGTHQYFCASLWEGFSKGDGAFTDGPYTIQEPKRFFEDSFYQYAFNPEIGNVGVPVAATIRATMDRQHWTPPTFRTLEDGSIVETPNACWDYHTYIPYSQAGIVRNQIALYGIPATLDAFCDQAQLVNFVQYRALLEAWNARMWTRYSGLLIWKTQNPWPGLRGQLYDCQLDQTAGFFGVRSACERVHMQLDLVTKKVQVINMTYDDVCGVVFATIFSLEGAVLHHQQHPPTTFPGTSATPTFSVPEEDSFEAPPVYFVLLKLESGSELLSRNFYWLSKGDGDFKALQGAWRERHVALRVAVSGQYVSLAAGADRGRYELVVEIGNDSDQELDQDEFTRLSWLKEDGESGIRIVGVEKNRDVTLEKKANLMHEQRGAVGEIEAASSYGSREQVESAARQSFEKKSESKAGVAFWLHLGVVRDEEESAGEKEGEAYVDRRILPVHYSDNYFTLIPGESRTVSLEFVASSENLQPLIVLEGWNVERRTFRLEKR